MNAPTPAARPARRNLREAPNRRGRRLVILLPYAWLAVFFLVPFLIVLKISLSQTAIAQPPYVPVLDLGGGFAGLREIFRRARSTTTLSASDPIHTVSYLSEHLDRSRYRPLCCC